MTSRFHSSVAGLLALTLVGCGPSAAVREAREARYDAPRDDMVATVGAVLRRRGHGVEHVDADQGVVFSGSRQYATNRGYVLVGYVVLVAGDDPPYQVTVEAQNRAYHRGWNQRRRTGPSAQYFLPGFAAREAEAIEVDIHVELTHPGVAR